MDEQQKRQVLRNIILMRMETISNLNECSYILKKTGIYPEKKINILLDRLNYLNRLEQELIS